MARRPLRIATTNQLAHAARVAGFDTYLLPETVNTDINRPLDQRFADGDVYGPFLEKHDIELVIDYDTAALTLSRKDDGSDGVCLTTGKLGIPYVCSFIDPVTSTMGQVPWRDRWRLLQNDSWIKWIWEAAHADELKRLGIPNVLTMPMAARDGDYDTSPPLVSDSGPVLACADTLLMGQFADATVLSVRRDVSRTAKVTEASDRLRSVGIEVIGSVLNGGSEVVRKNSLAIELIHDEDEHSHDAA